MIQLSWNYNYGAFSRWLYDSGLIIEALEETVDRGGGYALVMGCAAGDIGVGGREIGFLFGLACGKIPAETLPPEGFAVVGMAAFFAGVVRAPLTGIVGCIQAAEALKILIGAGQPLAGRLMLVDALAMDIRTIRLKKDAACAVCG